MECCWVILKIYYFLSMVIYIYINLFLILVGIYIDKIKKCLKEEGWIFINIARLIVLLININARIWYLMVQDGCKQHERHYDSTRGKHERGPMGK